MDDVTDRIYRASIARDAREYGDALALYQDALRIGGLQADILQACAMTSFALSVVQPTPADERGQEAIGYLERALRAEPTRADFHSELGTLYRLVAVPDHSRAAALHRQALILEPCHWDSLFALAMLFGAPENVVSLDEAIAFAERAAAIRPTKSVWIRLSQLYAHAGRAKDALAAQRKSMLAWLDDQPVRY